ncbi:MAG: hypothetical protein H6607_13435 [Flavobacteriales bacterium]|nr:hypothetical protein [Flavobacteriales bacterium]
MPRSNKIFIASDELYGIILYERKQEFQLLFNGFNNATGTYALSGDTIYLTYFDNQFNEFDLNQKLTRKILIDTKNGKVQSMDDRMRFCANIALDRRK